MMIYPLNTLYDLTLATGLLLSWPNRLYQQYRYGKYRLSKRKRWHIPSRTVDIRDPLLWIHAVSVGETKAIAPLATLIHERYPHYSFVVANMTETGHAEAKRSLPFAKAHLFAPWDLSFLARRCMAQWRPSLLLVSETDLWWQQLRYCRAMGGKVAVINGKLSKRSSERLAYFPWLRKNLWQEIDLYCAQHEEHEERLLQLDFPRERLKRCGNTKLDFVKTVQEESSEQTLPSTATEWLAKGQGLPLVVAGSTHPGEESLLIQAWQTLSPSLPYRLCIVPRHPERFEEVASWISSQSIPFHRLFKPPHQPKAPLCLCDGMGFLTSLYEKASLAFVGGSCSPEVGGHNVVEPCLVGTPSLFGPHTEQQRELVDLVLRFRSGAQLHHVENLISVLGQWLTNDALLRELRKGCDLLKEQGRGATDRTYQALLPLLHSLE